MIYLKTMLKVVDNSGGLLAECIKVLGKKPMNHASVGDKIVVVVQKAKVSNANGTGPTYKVKRSDICHAVVVRTKQIEKRKDGSEIRFDDNACVLINKNQEPIGTRVNSVVSKTLRDGDFSKIVAIASKAV